MQMHASQILRYCGLWFCPSSKHLYAFLIDVVTYNRNFSLAFQPFPQNRNMDNHHTHRRTQTPWLWLMALAILGIVLAVGYTWYAGTNAGQEASSTTATTATTTTLAAVADTKAPITLTDSRGKTVALPAAPTRIVSLLPSITESLCSLSMQVCQQHLVGVDRYSTWPPAVLEPLPKLGGGLDPNIEAIVQLKPDVVLISNASRSVERLESLGIPVIAMEAQNFTQAKHVLNQVQHLLQLPANTADGVWNTMLADMEKTAQNMPEQARGLRVYYEVSSSPHAAGETSFMGELLQRLGAKNIVGADLGPFPKINPEYIVRGNPEVIFVAIANAPALAQRPGWKNIDAIKNKRVCAITPAQRNVIIHPSPRMAQGLKVMAACLAQTPSPF